MSDSTISDTEDFPKQGIIADPNSNVPVIERQGFTVAIYDVVWRSGNGANQFKIRGYANKTITFNRIETRVGEHVQHTYKAYFTYRVGNNKGAFTDTLENEYNCKATSEDETSFYDFTFLRQGQHSDMEKPRFFFPDPPVLDQYKNEFMGICMVCRKGNNGQEIVGAWAKLRDSGETWETSELAELTNKEYAMLTDENGLARAIHKRECFDYWFDRRGRNGGPRGIHKSA